eukprot:gene14006-571_t
MKLVVDDPPEINQIEELEMNLLGVDADRAIQVAPEFATKFDKKEEEPNIDTRPVLITSERKCEIEREEEER